MLKQLFDKKIAIAAVKLYDENALLRNYIAEKHEEIEQLKAHISELNAEIREIENEEVQLIINSYLPEPIPDEVNDENPKKCCNIM